MRWIRGRVEGGWVGGGKWIVRGRMEGYVRLDKGGAERLEGGREECGRRRNQ